MTITRRSFIAGFGATAATSCLSPLLTHSIQREAKTTERGVLFARDYSGDGIYQLSLNMTHDYHPDFEMTCREFADRFMEGWVEASSWCFEEFSPSEFVDYDWAFEYWLRHNSGSAQAFHFLSSIDLNLSGETDACDEGWISFVDGPFPGNDSLIVSVNRKGLISLRRRLREIQAMTTIVIEEA